MITVSELAKELNISVQTVYRTLNAVKQSETESLTEKIKGVSYFTEFGERLIRERLTPVKQNEDDCLTEFNTVKQAENEEILFLREQSKTLLTELEREREHSRQQANRIADLADSLAELTRNTQILLKQEQDKSPSLLSNGQPPPAEPAEEITEPTTEPPKGFLKRLFGIKK